MGLRVRTIALCLGVACGIGAWGFFREAPPRRQLPHQTLISWRQYLRAGRFLGQHQAHDTIVVFTNFDCDSCSLLAKRLDSLLRMHPAVSIIERYFNRDRSSSSSADLAAACASVSEYPEVRHWLYGAKPLVAMHRWGLLAAKAGVADTSHFVRCIDDRATVAMLQLDSAVASSLHLASWSAVIVKGELYDGAPSLRTIEVRLGI